MAFSDPIDLFRGEAKVLPFAMDPVEDITGWTIDFTVEGAPNLPKLIEVAATVTDGPAGEFSVALTAADTDLEPGHYQYDAWRTDAGSERALAVGTFTVNDSARHPEET